MSVYAHCLKCGKKLKLGPIIQDINNPENMKNVEKIEDLLSHPECCETLMDLEEK